MMLERQRKRNVNPEVETYDNVSESREEDDMGKS